jgi:hypothetical protein
MTKRGTLTLIAIGGIIVAAIVILTFLRVSELYATGRITAKVAATRDIALVIDAIYSYPHDITLEYNYDLSDFIVEISQSSVRIYSTSLVTLDDEDKIRGKEKPKPYAFVPADDDPSVILDRPRKIVFEKEDGVLTITGIK